MLVEEDDDAPNEDKALALQTIVEELDDIGMTPSRLRHLMARKQITYRMKSRSDKFAAKIEGLFVKKREQLYQLRLRDAGIAGAQTFATIGNEYSLRVELLDLIDKEQKRQQTGDDDPYQFKAQQRRVRLIREQIVNRRDRISGRTVLHCAVGSGHFHLVRMLVHEFQVDPNVNTVLGHSTALHLAVENNFRQIASLLLTMGADVHAQDCQGCTPLHLVQKVTIAKLLIKFSSNPTVRNKHNRTAYDHYVYNTPTIQLDRDLVDLLRQYEDEKNLEGLREKVERNLALQAHKDNPHPLAISGLTTTSASRDLRKRLMGVG